MRHIRKSKSWKIFQKQIQKSIERVSSVLEEPDSPEPSVSVSSVQKDIFKIKNIKSKSFRNQKNIPETNASRNSLSK